MKGGHSIKNKVLSYLFLPAIALTFSSGCNAVDKKLEENKSKEVVEQVAGNIIGYSIEIPRMVGDWIFDNSPTIDENEFYMDLHCHWDVDWNVSELEEYVDTIMKKVDIIGVTGRGLENGEENYVSDYDIIKNKLFESGKYELKDLGNVLEVKSAGDIIYLVKAQEIKTSDGIEVVSVGCTNDFYERDDLETTLDNTNKEGFAFLPHNVLVPKNPYITFQIISKNEKDFIESLKDKYVALEGYNSNNPLNASSIIIATEFDEPIIGNSDSHFDAETAALSGTIIDKININLENGEAFIDSLENVFLNRKYRTHNEYNTPLDLMNKFVVPMLKDN